MIRLDNISKQNGHQLLFIEASMGIQKGEKVGLVGPNGAGKTTIFRMITGREEPDDGAVADGDGRLLVLLKDVRGHRAASENPEAAAVAEVDDGKGGQDAEDQSADERRLRVTSRSTHGQGA